MWPFSEMSLPVAGLVGTIANWTLLACLMGGVLATFVIVKTSDVKEDHWAEHRRQSNERIAELGTQQEVAKAAVAEGNARAKEAELKLEQLRKQMGPRRLDHEAFVKELETVPPQRAEILYLRDAPDALLLATDIFFELLKAKWTIDNPPFPIEAPPAGSTLARVPLTLAVGAQLTGVSAIANRFDKPELQSVIRAIFKGLGTAGGGTDESLPDGFIRIVVGPKP